MSRGPLTEPRRHAPPLTAEHKVFAARHLSRDARRVAIVAFASLVLSLILLWLIAQRTESRVRHGREVGRMARQVQTLAGERQRLVDAYVLDPSEAMRSLHTQRRALLAAKLDSLVILTRDNRIQQERAIDLARRVGAWDTTYAQPVLRALPGTAAPAAAGDDRALVDQIHRSASAFLAAEDDLYRTRERRADAANLLLLLTVIVELAAVGWALRRLYKRSELQTRELLETQLALEEQAVELEQQVEELKALTQQLEATNEELQEETAGRQRAEHGMAKADSQRNDVEMQLLQSQKMEAVGQLAGGVAHDFNNLLTVILSYASMARDQLRADDPIRADMLEIMESGQRAAALTRQLLAFSRKQVLQPHRLGLNDVIGEMDRMFRRLIGADVDLTLTLMPDLGPVHADKTQVEQILLNLVVNARDAMPDGGRITIETAELDLERDHGGRRIGVEPGQYVMLAVSDTGSGMAPETLTHLFEPFFTTKPSGRGTGLGLSTVYGIVKQSGGDLWVYSEVGHGTTIKVYLPRATPEQLRRRTPTHAGLPSTGTETILLAEDDAALRTLSVRVLEEAGYHVIAAANGAAAIDLAREHKGIIHLVATDVVMPLLTGRSLAEQVATTRPGVKVLFMSGYTDDDVMRRGVFQDRVAFLQKPFTPAEFRLKVREVLDG